MLAQIKYDQPNKLTFYPAGYLSEPAEDLLKNIGGHQSNLQKFLSKTLAYSEKKLSFSLRMFLNESKNRLHLFVLTLDEIMGHASVLNQYDSSLIKNLPISSVTYFSDRKILNEIFRITNLLCDMITQLKEKIEMLEAAAFIKDFCSKSLIFYKQTQVVLKGYLRTIEEQKSDPR